MSHMPMINLAWSSFFAGGVVTLLYIVAHHENHLQRTPVSVVLISIFFFAGLLQLPPLQSSLRWILTLVAFAAPVALSVIAIRELIRTPRIDE